MSEERRTQGYTYELVNINCLPNSDHYNIVMEMEESIEDLLPYLAASLPGCTYIHGSGVVNFMDAGHIVAVYPRQMTITDVTEKAEADELCNHYFGKIKEVKAQRETITPIYLKRSTITVLDIFRALPGTNCGLCLSPTCMAFAAKVFRREDSIASCKPILNESKERGEIFHQLQMNGYEIA